MVWGRTNFQNACVKAAIFCPMLTLLPPPSPDIPEADAADAWAATCGDLACVLCWWLKGEVLEGKGADTDGDVTLDGDITLVGCASFGAKGRHNAVIIKQTCIQNLMKMCCGMANDNELQLQKCLADQGCAVTVSAFQHQVDFFLLQGTDDWVVVKCRLALAVTEQGLCLLVSSDQVLTIVQVFGNQTDHRTTQP